MPVSNLGRIGFVTRGDWSAGPYKYLDVVTHSHSTWICAVPESSQEPGSGSDWQVALSAPPFKTISNWSELLGEQSPPLIVYDDNKYWSLTTTVSNIALNKPADSPVFFKHINDSYIDDSSTSADKAWSSEKTENAIGARNTAINTNSDAISNLQTNKRDLNNTSFPRYDLASATTTNTLNLAQQQVFRVDASSVRALTFTNQPGADRAMTVVVHITGNKAVTWPAGIDWDADIAPELGEGFTRVVLFWDGVSWSGMVGVAK